MGDHERGYAELMSPSASAGRKDTLQSEENQEEDLAIDLTFDAYDAVVAAAFGGIRVMLPSTAEGASRVILLHPLVIFMFCLLLFVIQCTCLQCLVLDMELTSVYKGQTWEGFDTSPERRMKLTIRTIMVTVLQMIGLKELLGSLKPMFFCLNPYTWFELVRPSRTGKGWVFHGGICAPICVAAQAMQFWIAYYVLIVSMSVIIIAESVKDVIFNGLVVIFLADLDEAAWLAVASIFHMDQNHFENFRFNVRKDYEVEQSRKDARRSATIWLFRGKGGKASVLDSIAVFSFLTMIYVKQLFMYIQAVDTGILPVARDVCSFYRGIHNSGANWIAYLLVQAADFVTLIDYPAMVNATVHKQKNYEGKFMSELCLSQQYRDNPMDKAIYYINLWPRWVVTALCLLFAMFVVPQLFYANHVKFKKILDGIAD